MSSLPLERFVGVAALRVIGTNTNGSPLRTDIKRRDGRQGPPMWPGDWRLRCTRIWLVASAVVESTCMILTPDLADLFFFLDS